MDFGYKKDTLGRQNRLAEQVEQDSKAAIPFHLAVFRHEGAGRWTE